MLAFGKCLSTKFKKCFATLPCNCRNKSACPMDGKCRSKSVIYKCVAVVPNERKVYLGLTEDEWKKRYYNHTQSFRNEKYQKSTTLSNYLWELKSESGEIPELIWSIEKSIPAYSNTTKRCLLCLHEKLAISTYERPSELLNKRSELTSKCRHENKYLLCNYDND